MVKVFNGHYMEINCTEVEQHYFDGNVLFVQPLGSNQVLMITPHFAMKLTRMFIEHLMLPKIWLHFMAQYYQRKVGING